MHEWMLRLIEQGGYWGIALLMVLENIFPPIPSEVIMGLGGVGVSRGVFSFWPLLIVGTLGSTLGNYVWFLVGSRCGYRRLEPFVARWGRWLTLEWEDVEKGTEFFRRHGQWVVFALRFSPLLRTIVSLPAGLVHMNHARFLVFTFAGSAIWNSALILGGQWLATQQELIGPVVTGFILLALIAYLWRVVTWRPKG
jgi:membrane protein DedA with SNARE-associated domain